MPGSAIKTLPIWIDLAWKSRPDVVLHPLAPTGGVAAPAVPVRETAILAAKSWNEALAGCGAPRLLIAPIQDGKRAPVRDGANTIAIRRDHWCPPGAQDRSQCYSAQRAAITHIHRQDGSGALASGVIVEADLEINAIDYSWSNAEELEALFVHEFGHVLGLVHPCGPGTSCQTPEARASVMYPNPTEAGRTLLLAPDAAAVAAVCDGYGGRPFDTPLLVAGLGVFMALCLALVLRLRA